MQTPTQVVHDNPLDARVRLRPPGINHRFGMRRRIQVQIHSFSSQRPITEIENSQRPETAWAPSLQKCRLSLRERTFFRGAKDDNPAGDCLTNSYCSTECNSLRVEPGGLSCRSLSLTRTCGLKVVRPRQSPGRVAGGIAGCGRRPRTGRRSGTRGLPVPLPSRPAAAHPTG